MKRLSLLFAVILLFGCAHAISKEMRERVDRDVHPAALLKDPDSYKGKFVMLGGIIVNSNNTPEGTYLEVLEMPLDSSERPDISDKSRGRFLILSEGYLDSAIYAPGREITVAGEVAGKMVRPLDNIQYTYLLVKSKQLSLFEPRRRPPVSFGIGIFHSF